MNALCLVLVLWYSLVWQYYPALEETLTQKAPIATAADEKFKRHLSQFSKKNKA